MFARKCLPGLSILWSISLPRIFYYISLQGCDAAYLTNLHAEFESHADFVKGEDRRTWDKSFGVRHYAGTVTYAVEGFVDKNRDAQQDVFFDFLEKSERKFVQEICNFKVRFGERSCLELSL
jgi:myosin heavy subunit